MTLIIIINPPWRLMLLHMWLSRRSTSATAAELSSPTTIRPGGTRGRPDRPEVPEPEPHSNPKTKTKTKTNRNRSQSRARARRNWKDEPDFEVELAKATRIAASDHS